jgi:type III secretion system FlhB-like substrate exporter
MARKKQSAEQIINKLREAEVALAQGKDVKAVCKQLEVTEQTSSCPNTRATPDRA